MSEYVVTETESPPTLVDDTMSPQIDKLATALAKAQCEITGATKDSTNPFFHSTYADLASVIDACKPLSDHGLSYAQLIGSRGAERTVMTMLLHTSGQWLRSTVGVTPAKADAQAAGSVYTYLRRYALAAIAGISAIDDDGNAGSEPAPKPAAKKNALSLLKAAKTLPALKAAWERLSPEQHKTIGKDTLDELKAKLEEK